MTEYIIRPPERVDSSLSLWPIIVGEIVRCRDCKHYHPEMYNNINCEWFMSDVEPEGFCAWGERKEGGE